MMSILLIPPVSIPNLTARPDRGAEKPKYVFSLQNTDPNQFDHNNQLVHQFEYQLEQLFFLVLVIYNHKH